MNRQKTNVLRDAILGIVIILATSGILACILLPPYNRTRHWLEEDRKYHKNTAAINKAMGFIISAGTKEGSYHDRGMEILQVSPGGPADRAGLRARDQIKKLDYHFVKQQIVKQSGKSLVLPIERAGRHFDCTVHVPKFALPFPNVKV